ncbi:MAG: DUF465 domain-containing protein [Cypionkella sp.]|nr:DUF465 domain-containing protein [Cypionkella sp.]
MNIARWICKSNDLAQSALPDRLAIQRLKKQKLVLKDQITALSAQLIPNIIA